MSVPLSLIEWLQNWYKEQCNGEWEHVRGVTIETLGAPGWLVTVDLAGTPLEGVAMPLARRERCVFACYHCVANFKGLRRENVTAFAVLVDDARNKA